MERTFIIARNRWYLFQKLKDPNGPGDRMIYRDDNSQNVVEIIWDSYKIP